MSQDTLTSDLRTQAWAPLCSACGEPLDGPHVIGTANAPQQAPKIMDREVRCEACGEDNTIGLHTVWIRPFEPR